VTYAKYAIMENLKIILNALTVKNAILK
jgi:hypothetical protein